MKLQNLLIIFVIIALPVILVLSLYIGYQVDTINLKSMYDSKLLGATYDSLVAFELNTTNNKYSTVSDSLVRDIEASIKTFSNAFSTSIRKTGSSRGDVLSYVPALVYALYDGYYIYSPMTTVDDLGNTSFEHELKPYVYYTKEYNYGTNSKLVINYSLDNYVVVYDYDKSNNQYTSKAGYLELIASAPNQKGVFYDGTVIWYNGIRIENEETLVKNINNTGEKEISPKSTSAFEYYKEAYEFTKNYYNKIIEKFGARNWKL